MIFYLISCRKTNWMEKLGTLLVIGGTTLMILDPTAVKEGERVSITTSLLCLASNIPGVLFWFSMDRL
jgi:hypothetical protein